MLRVKVTAKERAYAAHVQAQGIREAAGLAPLEPMSAPDGETFLLVEPPADMSVLPEQLRKHVLAAALNAGAVGSASPALRGEALIAATDAALQAQAQMCIHCVRGKVVVKDGAETETRFRVVATLTPGKGELPLAAIEQGDRQAVQEAVLGHINSFRDLL